MQHCSVVSVWLLPLPPPPEGKLLHAPYLRSEGKCAEGGSVCFRWSTCCLALLHMTQALLWGHLLWMSFWSLHPEQSFILLVSAKSFPSLHLTWSSFLVIFLIRHAHHDDGDLVCLMCLESKPQARDTVDAQWPTKVGVTSPLHLKEDRGSWEASYLFEFAQSAWTQFQ